MPYITEKLRAKALTNPVTAGELTYAFTKSIQNFMRNSPEGYTTYSQILGALEGAKADFIERVLTPYEGEKQEVNGDVWDIVTRN